MDKTVSAGVLLAWVLWIVSLALWGASWWLGHEIGLLSIIACAGAATATVRTFIVRHDRQMRSAMMVASSVSDIASPNRTRRD